MASTAPDRLSTLRLELKQWEKRFAASHEGRKASRDEIKADADIAAKYKEYNRLREGTHASNHTQRQSNEEAKDPVSPSASRKRKYSKDVERSPSKRIRGAATETPRKSRFVEQFTPSSGRNKEEEQGLDVTPTVTRTFVGPTPQKDGLVLGLFDTLDVDMNVGTPSKTRTEEPLQETAHNVVASTPRKNNADAQGKLIETPQTGARQRFIRTPQSLGQRFLLDQFITPSKRKRDDENDETLVHPGDNSKENDESTTPAFLRRDSRSKYNHGLSSIVEDAETSTFSPSKAPSRPRSAFGFTFGFGKGAQRRKLGRSLSDMIADLRKAEDDRLDEEAEIMREMEEGGDAPAPIPARKPITAQSNKTPAIIVEDSQAPLPNASSQLVASNVEVEHALGPDGTGDLSADSDAEKEMQENAGRKVWKKKGQKRTTRRVVMKPRAKPPRPAENEYRSESSSDTDRDKEDNDVQDSQLGTKTSRKHDNGGNDSDADETRNEQKKNTSTSKKSSSKKQKEKKESGVEKAARKVSNVAHANFRKLKIKSKNGSGKSNGRRFGRR